MIAVLDLENPADLFTEQLIFPAKVEEMLGKCGCTYEGAPSLCTSIRSRLSVSTDEILGATQTASGRTAASVAWQRRRVAATQLASDGTVHSVAHGRREVAIKPGDILANFAEGQRM